MPTLDLKQNYRDEDGTLYRAGRGVEVPDALAARIRTPKQGATPAPADPATPVATGTGAGTGAALPDDFPAREPLMAAGLTTREAVAAQSDAALVALKGIGEASVLKIRAALHAPQG